MRDVEDSLSGVPENLEAATAPSDGRMYPPSDNFEVDSGTLQVRLFKQRRHRTYIGDNGALQIATAQGNLAIDLAGSDGRTITDLVKESSNEPNHIAARRVP